MKHNVLKHTILLFCAMTLIAFQALAQRKVSGKITDETKEGLPGVAVIVKGTTTGTISDFDGNYTLNVEDGSTLVFSFVGYSTQEVAVGNRAVVDINMETDQTTLSEVVVVGYGTQEKKEITSSVTSVKAKDFNQGLVNDPNQLIQGKVGGLTVAKPGGDPNGGYTVRLRGVSTFGANAEPLVVLDGVIGGSLDAVDPNDIASIDVLKDGSAAAIYGTRASSGVILVTTKRGKSGETTFDYNASVAFERVANTIDFFSPEEFRNTPGTTDLGSETDWLDEVTSTAVSHIHNVSMSGGVNNSSYRASFNYRNVEGVGNGTGFEQLNGRLNLTQRALNDNLTLDMNLSVTTKDQDLAIDEVFDHAITANPTLPVLFDGSPGTTDVGGFAERDIFRFWNPVSIQEQLELKETDFSYLGSARLEYDFSDQIEGLRFAVSYSQQRKTIDSAFFAPSTAKLFGSSGPNGIAGRNQKIEFNQLGEFTGNYDFSVGALDLAVLGGYSYQEFKNEGFGLSGGNFPSDEFSFNNLGSAQDFDNGLGNAFSSANSNKLIAGFGRVNLNYDGTYFLSASLRREGSSRFGADQRWGTFYAVSGGVNLDNLFALNNVDQLKLRAGYGVTGAQPGQSLLSVEKFGPTGSFFFNGGYVPSFGPVSNENPDLKWETKKEVDIGLDFAILDGRLQGTIDWYRRVTSDLLFNISVPVPPNQFDREWRNVGEMTNTGIEIALDYEVVNTGDFKYNTAVNYATFQTEIKKLDNSPLFEANFGSPGQNDTRLARVADGEPLGQLFLPVKIGIWSASDQEAIDDPSLVGSPRFEDLDGDGTYCTCNDDKRVVGNGLPDFTIGWANNFVYKNFDLNLFFRGAFGHDLLNSYRGFYENFEGTTVANYNIVKGSGLDPALTKAEVNSSHVESASFFKLDNATIGYNLPVGDNKSGLRRLRFYFAVQNPFVITGYDGIDPEVRYEDLDDPDNPNALAPGIERRNTYFTTKTYTFGMNLGF